VEIEVNQQPPKQNGPLLVQTGRWSGVRVRYRLRP
jgi:hypothetical protein